MTKRLKRLNALIYLLTLYTLAWLQLLQIGLINSLNLILLYLMNAIFSAAKTWQKIIEAFPKAYIVGLTATPCRLDGKPLGSIYNKLIECTTARQLIEQGYLSPYKYYAPCVADLSALQRKGSDFNADKATELLSTRAVFGDVIKHYKSLC